MAGTVELTARPSSDPTKAPEPVLNTDGAAHVRTLAELDLSYTPFETSDQTTTHTTQTISAGARVVTIYYRDIGSAVGDVLYVVFNADDDTDANSKLTTAGQRFVVPIGSERTWVFPEGSEVTRIDYESNVASETGDSLVYGEYGVAA